MPCSDITEYLTLVLDTHECVSSFQLQKLTCGAPVGLLDVAKLVHGQPVTAIYGRELIDVVPNAYDKAPSAAFLLAKQWLALQAALAVYLGEGTGAKGETFCVEEIDYGPEGVTIKGMVAVNGVDVSQITACGSRKKEKQETTTLPG